MTILNEAADAAAIESALRAYREASDNLVDILTSGTAPLSKTAYAYDWPKSPNLLDLDGPAGSAKVKTPETTRVYVAGCQGLKSLSNELQIPLFKIGSTSGDISQRLAEVDADRYGSSYRKGEQTIVDQGFDRWKLLAMDHTLPRIENSPVTIEPRALCVNLPKPLTRTRFEARLRRALKPISLTHWLKTRDCKSYFAARGINADRAGRYTPYNLGNSVRLSPANEIYIFHHATEFAHLHRLVELIARAENPEGETWRTLA